MFCTSIGVDPKETLDIWSFLKDYLNIIFVLTSKLSMIDQFTKNQFPDYYHELFIVFIRNTVMMVA